MRLHHAGCLLWQRDMQDPVPLLGTFHEWDMSWSLSLSCYEWGSRRILSSQDWDLRFAASVPIPRQMVMSFMFDDAGPDAR